MHTYQLNDVLVTQTGTMFGDNTCPRNFDPLARGCRQLAPYLWGHPFVGEHGLSAYPPIRMSDPHTATELATFSRATPNVVHQGVIAMPGERLPTDFPTHADDFLYGGGDLESGSRLCG